MSEMHPTATVDPDLILHLRALTRVIHYVTHDELRFLTSLNTILGKKHENRVIVHHPVYGAGLLKDLMACYRQVTGTAGTNPNTDTTLFNALKEAPFKVLPKGFKECSIEKFVEGLFADDPRDEQNFYIILDSDQHMGNSKVVRSIKDYLLQAQIDLQRIRVLFLLTSEPEVPSTLKRQVVTINDHGPTRSQLETHVGTICQHLKAEVPKNIPEMYKGLTYLEVDTACTMSMIKTAKAERRVVDDEEILKQFQKRVE